MNYAIAYNLSSGESRYRTVRGTWVHGLSAGSAEMFESADAAQKILDTLPDDIRERCTIANMG